LVAMMKKAHFVTFPHHVWCVIHPSPGWDTRRRSLDHRVLAHKHDIDLRAHLMLDHRLDEVKAYHGRRNG